MNRQKAKGNRQKHFSNAYCRLPISGRASRGSRGFTLLLAALVSSITLALGIAVFQIAYKQVNLSTIGRDSQYAFYTADTGAECALYWDIRHNYFGTTTPSGSAVCANQILSMTGRQPAPPYTMNFEFEPNGYCTRVSVAKSATNPRTVIRADGFNAPNCAAMSGSRILQRTIQIEY